MAVQTYEATVVFDTPMKFDSKFKPGEQYYSMSLELPEGAPGTEYVEGKGYARYQAYITFDEGSDEEAYLLSLKSGDKLMVAWQTSGKRSKYVPVIPDHAVEKQKPAPSSQGQENAASQEPPPQPAPSSPPRTQVTSPSASPTYPTYDEDGTYSGESLVAYDAAIEEAIFMLEMAYRRVAENESLGELPDEVQQKYAVTAFLSAKNRFKNIDAHKHVKMKRVKDLLEKHTNPVEARKAIHAIDPERLPGSLLDEIASLLSLESEDVIGILKRFGLSRENINPRDKSTWWRMYVIASYFTLAKEESGEEEAAQATAYYFDLDRPKE